MANATLTYTKRCPGVQSLGLEPHEATATLEFFASNAANRDLLATRCKVCGAAYGKAWSAAKKAGTTFSAKIGNGQAGPPAQEPATGDPTEPAVPAEAGGQPARKPRKGWAIELVAGTEYPMPGDEQVGTPEGQAALEVLNRARDAERRRRATEAKRAQRARAKAAAAELADGPRL